MAIAAYRSKHENVVAFALHLDAKTQGLNSALLTQVDQFMGLLLVSPCGSY
jgi:hypothetical protein